jgi:glycosyltransferase involved in cell wall biosynthesis
MKILLSAYACEPNKGSEPGVGWHWAIELARLGHEVFVLTRANNRPVIEDALRKEPVTNIHFLYYDLPEWAKFWKKGERGVHMYYLLWQLGAYRVAKRMHKQVQFDLAHHITFVSVRQPSFMGLLGIPFVFGPVAGGESAPWKLRIGYDLKGWLKDGLRDFSNFMVCLDPMMHLTFSTASRIFATSRQTEALIPARYRNKVDISLAIGLDSGLLEYLSQENRRQRHDQGAKVLCVGRLLYFKGLHLGLPAFARLREKALGATLTLIGSGPDEQRLKNMARRLAISDAVTWIPWMEREEVLSTYKNYDIFLFPSLHDSGGMVVLEAMAAGLPVVCLDLGGPGVIVDETCGMKIDITGKGEREVVDSITKVLALIEEDKALYAKLCQGALKRSKEYLWSRVVRGISENA